MDHYSPRRYRGPATWALVRDAYLAGEPAPIVARRYDVGLANLRRKARTEGWTRADHARAADRAPAAARTTRAAPQTPPPPPPPSEDPWRSDDAWDAPPADPLRAALDRAAAQIAAGRGADAAATLKAAEALRRLQGELTAAAAPEPPPAAAPRQRTAQEEAVRHDQLRELIDERAHEIALGLLQADCAALPAVHLPFALHWRAHHLGPEVARADHAHATAAGWSLSYYTPQGALRPLADLLADGRRRMWRAFDPADDDLPLSATPDPAPPAGPTIRAL